MTNADRDKGSGHSLETPAREEKEIVRKLKYCSTAEELLSVKIIDMIIALLLSQTVSPTERERGGWYEGNY